MDQSVVSKGFFEKMFVLLNRTNILSENLILHYTLLLALSSVMGFPDSSVGKESAYKSGDPCLIPGLQRSPGEGRAYPLP